MANDAKILDSILNIDLVNNELDCVETLKEIQRIPKDEFKRRMCEEISRRRGTTSEEYIKKKILDARQQIVKETLNQFKAPARIKIGKRNGSELALEDIYLCANCLVADRILPDMLLLVTTNAGETIQPSEMTQVLSEIHFLHNTQKEMKETIEKLATMVRALKEKLDATEDDDERRRKTKKPASNLSDLNDIFSLNQRNSISFDNLSQPDHAGNNDLANMVFNGLSGSKSDILKRGKPLYSDLARQAAKDWGQESSASSKKNLVMRKKDNYIIGSSKKNDTKVPKKAEKTFHFYTSGWDSETTEDEIKAYIVGIVKDDVQVERKTLRHSRFAGFRFAVNEKHNEKILNPNNWVSGVLVKRYYFSKEEREAKSDIRPRPPVRTHDVITSQENKASASVQIIVQNPDSQVLLQEELINVSDQNTDNPMD